MSILVMLKTKKSQYYKTLISTDTTSVYNSRANCYTQIKKCKNFLEKN